MDQVYHGLGMRLVYVCAHLYYYYKESISVLSQMWDCFRWMDGALPRRLSWRPQHHAASALHQQLLLAVEEKYSKHDEIDQIVGRKGEQLLLHHHFKVCIRYHAWINPHWVQYVCTSIDLTRDTDHYNQTDLKFAVPAFVQKQLRKSLATIDPVIAHQVNQKLCQTFLKRHQLKGFDILNKLWSFTH